MVFKVTAALLDRNKIVKSFQVLSCKLQEMAYRKAVWMEPEMAF